MILIEIYKFSWLLMFKSRKVIPTNKSSEHFHRKVTQHHADGYDFWVFDVTFTKFYDFDRNLQIYLIVDAQITKIPSIGHEFWKFWWIIAQLHVDGMILWAFCSDNQQSSCHWSMNLSFSERQYKIISNLSSWSLISSKSCPSAWWTHF